MKIVELLEERPPTCLHILGQDLVNTLHAEGRELLAQRDELRVALTALREVVNDHKGHGMPSITDRGDCYLALNAANAALARAGV